MTIRTDCLLRHFRKVQPDLCDGNWAECKVCEQIEREMLACKLCIARGGPAITLPCTMCNMLPPALGPL